VQEQANFWVRRILPEFPRSCPKSFLYNFYLQIFSHKDHEDLFLVKPPKKGFYLFLCKPWAPFLEVKQPWALFLHRFSGFLPRFLATPKFCGCACNPCTPSSNTTAFHNSILSNFMAYQDRLETNLLQLFQHQENSE